MINENFWNDENVLDFVSKTIHDRLEWALIHDASAAPVPIQISLSKYKAENLPEPVYEASKQSVSLDWEIISWNILGDIVPNAYNRRYDPRTTPIHSVKRIKDGEVFTVGDIIYDRNFPMLRYNDEKRNQLCPIDNFRIAEAYGNPFISVSVKVNPSHFSSFSLLEAVRPPAPLKESRPLFVSNEGIALYLGDKYYHINEDWEVCEAIVGRSKHINAFSKKESCEEYILLNKKILSLNEIIDQFGYRSGDVWFIGGTKDNFIQFAKEKL